MSFRAAPHARFIPIWAIASSGMVMLASMILPLATSTAAGCESTQSCEKWVARMDGRGASDDFGQDIAVSKNRVFVTGTVHDKVAEDSTDDYLTVAYNAETGAELWRSRFNRQFTRTIGVIGPEEQQVTANTVDQAQAIDVSPAGNIVFVTGSSTRFESTGIQTVAYNADTGAELWTKRYDGPPGDLKTYGPDEAADLVAVAGKVIVTGGSFRNGQDTDYVTLAYNSADGNEQWVSRYDNGNTDSPVAIDAGPEAAYVTGYSRAPGGAEDFATVAYSLDTGAQRWVARYDGGSNRADFATDVVAPSNSSAVYVTGATTGASLDYATVAYDTLTGSQMWAAIYDGAGGDDEAHAITSAPDGVNVFVTGNSDRGGATRITTISYGPGGIGRWESVHTGPRAAARDNAADIGLRPGGKRVYVTGDVDVTDSDRDIVNMSYDSTSGQQMWNRRRGGSGSDIAAALATSSEPATFYETSSVSDPTTFYNYETVAYDDTLAPPPSAPPTSTVTSTATATSTATTTATATATATKTATATSTVSSTTTVTPGRPRATTSIEANKTRTRYREPFELSGRVQSEPGCDGPFTVSILKRRFGENGFTVARRRIEVGPDNTWRATHRSKVNATYAAEVDDNATCEGRMSGGVDVLVRAGITVRPPDGCVAPQALTGRVLPDKTGTRVRLDIRRNGAWRRVDRAWVSDTSRFKLFAPKCGRAYRVVWPKQDIHNITGKKRVRL